MKSLREILRMIEDTEESCRKVQTTNMKYIIVKDALLIIKHWIMRYLEEIES